MSAFDVETQKIKTTTVGNSRELGGYPIANGKHVKRGCLLRSGRLADASAEDLRLLSEGYRVKLVVDFRADAEAAAMPDPVVTGAQYIRIPVIDEEIFGDTASEALVHDDTLKDPIQEMIRIAETRNLDDMYVLVVQSEYGQRGYERFFRELINVEDGAVLWHCTAGKDRTGLAAALLLAALGADWQTILFDFKLTNRFTAGEIDTVRQELLARGCSDRLIKAVLSFVGVDGRYLKNAWDSMQRSDGSVIGYLKNKLHLCDADFGMLRERYLE